MLKNRIILLSICIKFGYNIFYSIRIFNNLNYCCKGDNFCMFDDLYSRFVEII